MARWASFLWPFIVLGWSNPALPVALRPQSTYFKGLSRIMRRGVLATLPLVALFAVAGQHLVSGVMAGAVKG